MISLTFGEDLYRSGNHLGITADSFLPIARLRSWKLKSKDERGKNDLHRVNAPLIATLTCQQSHAIFVLHGNNL